jgi:Holliday junction resolvasome RuvABC endonuclease subunit
VRVRILALDLATRTGWAAGDTEAVGARLESGVQEFALGRGESPGMRFLRFGVWLREIVALHRPEVVLYEQPFVMRSGAAAEISLGFATRVQEACATHAIEHQAVNGATLKKWATGRGNAKKPDMIAAARQRFGVEPRSSDEADALLLLGYGREQYGR